MVYIVLITVQINTMVNYPPTAKLMGWASEVIDSPNGNALLRFCFISDSIPEPDSNKYKLPKYKQVHYEDF